MKETEVEKAEKKLIRQIKEVADHLYTERNKGNNVELTKQTLRILINKL